MKGISSVGERFVDAEEVMGSIPIFPTIDALWCNGSTVASEAISSGSNPDGVAKCLQVFACMI